MNKLSTLFFSLIVGAGTVFASVNVNDIAYNLSDVDLTAEVTKLSSGRYSGDIVIPDTIKYNSQNYTVTSIGEGAFNNCYNLTSIEIPNSVISIGECAFEGCFDLTTVTIGNSVTSINKNTFSSCRSLAAVNIPNSVRNIGENAFQYCERLTTINIPDGITTISRYAFSCCSGLTSVTIGNSVTSIGDYAFYSCKSIPSVTLPYSVTSIGVGAFSGCSSLTDINVASSNQTYSSVDGVVFNKNQTELVLYPSGKQGAYNIPNVVTSIGDYAFLGCTGLTSIDIPNSVTSIGEGAFNCCKGLTSIDIPNSITAINQYTFSECYALATISIPNSVTSIGVGAFHYCERLRSINIPNSVTSIGNYAFRDCTGLTSMTIPNNITSIEEGVFLHCTRLSSVTIPKSVTSIGNYAFFGCTGLSKVNITNIAAWCNIIFSGYESNPLFYAKHIYLNDTEIANLIIPNNVSKISKYAFYNCADLSSVTIPNSVTSIGDNAFHGCSGLTTITIPDSVTSIGDGVLQGCDSLVSVTCYALVPPTLSSHPAWPTNISTVYVPEQSVTMYKRSQGWKDLRDIIVPIGATPTPADDVQVEPSETTVTIVWPSISGAASYELIIKDMSGNEICTLIFNAEGILTSITFYSPTRDGVLQQAQTAGFSFTVTGLEEGSTYDLTIAAKDINGNTLDTQMISFTTESAQAIDQITNYQLPITNKVIKDGQILILRGDKTYTLQGQEVK